MKDAFTTVVEMLPEGVLIQSKSHTFMNERCRKLFPSNSALGQASVKIIKDKKEPDEL